MTFHLWQGFHRLIENPIFPADEGYSSAQSSPVKKGRHNENPAFEIFCDKPNLPTIGLNCDGPSDGLEPLSASTPTKLNARTPFKLKSRPSLKSNNSGSSSKSFGSRSPDRFLPTRSRTQNAATQSFRVNKNIDELSPDERLLRNNEASLDAFDPRHSSPTSRTSPSRLVAERTFSLSSMRGGSALAIQPSSNPTQDRQVSIGTVWAVGGVAPIPNLGIPNGRGHFLGSGTTAPFYSSSFPSARPHYKEELQKHEGRLAQALDLDRVQRILEFQENFSSPLSSIHSPIRDGSPIKTTWQDSEWMSPEIIHMLDAPNLRDDFYCTILAYSYTGHTLAVGLGNMLYLWSEKDGVEHMDAGSENNAWLTSISFSSAEGCKSIIAFGRSDGSLTLMSLHKQKVPQTTPIAHVFQPRFELKQPLPIACVAWRPTVTLRHSRSPWIAGMLVKTEDLLVGDELGNVYCYSVEWPEFGEAGHDGWVGCMTLMAKIQVHSQQICGISFTQDGSLFATGANDNLCCLFQSNSVLRIRNDDGEIAEEVFPGIAWGRIAQRVTGRGRMTEVKAGDETHCWIHGAAVKAIAFCPWRKGLIATGGGSNDKCIHFWHTGSGACLATISVAAQVTSLIWSTTRREIVATFGYPQPDHPYRIAVYSWPACKQIAAIPWDGEHRALYAIPYPGGPNEKQKEKSHEGNRGMSRTAMEGCIVVASSDQSVKFHEVWTAGQKATTGGEGLLGGSDILEYLEGIDKEGELIR